VRRVLGERHRLNVYVVVYLRDAFLVVLDYGIYGTYFFGNEAADVVGRLELRVARVVAAKLCTVNGWSAVPIGERLRLR
jgi:hypothetical protein